MHLTLRSAVVIFLYILAFTGPVTGQDSSFILDKKVVTLKEVVVRSNLNTAKFIERVQQDSSFYKAFRNLRILGYTALNDIRMLDKKSNSIASLASRTRQTVKNNCPGWKHWKK